MNFLRRFIVSLAGSTLFSFLFLAVLLASINSVVTKPDNIKLWLKQSNVYSHLVPDLIALSTSSPTDQNQNTSSDSVSLDQPAIKDAAVAAFSPQFLEQSANNIIDGTYHWLDGKTTTPDFKVDASGPKQAFAGNVNAYLTNRLGGLAVCKPAEVPSTFDAFNATCIPRGFNVNAEINRVTGDIAGSKDFLPNPVLTNATLTTTKGDSSQPISTKYKNAPQYYQHLKLAPILSGLVALMAAATVLFASTNKRKGLRRICTTLAITGVLLILSVVLVNRVSALAEQKINQANNKPASVELQKDVLFIGRKIAGAINHTDTVFGSIFIVLAAGGFGYLFFTKLPKPPKETEVVASKEPAPAATKAKI